MSLLPPSLVLPFYGQQLQSRISVRDAGKEIAVPKQSKLGGDTPVSSGYLGLS